MKMRVLFISFLLLFAVGLFAVDSGPPGLDIDINDVEFSISDNTQMNDVVIDNLVASYTGEGIVLEYSMDIANDLNQFSEATTVQLISRNGNYEDVFTRDLQLLYRDPLVSNYRHPPELWTMNEVLTWNQSGIKESKLNTGLSRLGVGKLNVFV